ncbi:fumble-domain-containing protein [Patellaria atrata CBS 101060]|uniref:Fumble-domain-containing protein n=1 Tax=Patellaria atrata CBS 101060 TaxID=1346257 RepID=A0A9P4S8B8_9PEZI|nr:fumble-domain-containing protein [Patellaria atrata CBS 101060]
MTDDRPPSNSHNASEPESSRIRTNSSSLALRPLLKRPHASSNADIESAIRQPGSVYINVEGAFIVDNEDGVSPRGGEDWKNGEDGDVKFDSNIRLPNQTAVVSHIAVDIGGSLAKLVYFSREPSTSLAPSATNPSATSHKAIFGPQVSAPGGRLNFLKFETIKINACFEFMKQLQRKYNASNGSGAAELCVMATGGGAFKFYEQIKEALGVKVLREDEMECLIMGLDFFITEIPSEVFTYSETFPPTFLPPRPDIYPYLLVNIGSGVSMIKVSSPRNYERVGGTALGGGTLWGLLGILTGARNFDEMLALAEKGDNTNVDMLVGDIYGTDYGKIGLTKTTIASTFGKVYRKKYQAEQYAEDHGGLANGDWSHDDGAPEGGVDRDNRNADEEDKFRPEDISKSLLYAISNNIGQIAYLQAKLHNLEHIYFGGSFIGGHRQTMNTLSYAIKFWSKGEKQAYFLRHEGYLGAVGAFLKRQPRNWGRRASIDGLGEAGGFLERVRSRGEKG